MCSIFSTRGRFCLFQIFWQLHALPPPSAIKNDVIMHSCHTCRDLPGILPLCLHAVRDQTLEADWETRVESPVITLFSPLSHDIIRKRKGVDLHETAVFVCSEVLRVGKHHTPLCDNNHPPTRNMTITVIHLVT